MTPGNDSSVVNWHALKPHAGGNSLSIDSQNDPNHLHYWAGAPMDLQTSTNEREMEDEHSHKLG